MGVFTVGRMLIRRLALKRVVVYRWQLNAFGVFCMTLGLVAGTYLTLFEVFPKIFAISQSSITKDTDAELGQGGFSSTEVSGSGSSAVVRLTGIDEGWWNTSWTKRKRVTISAASDNGVSSGYTIAYSCVGSDAADIYNDSLSNGNDLRVVYWNGSSWVELDRDLVTFSVSEIEVWFKLQAGISGGSSDNNYFIYYANSGAGSPPADKDNIYQFWDDFLGSSLDTDKWNPYGAGYSVADSVLHFQHTSPEMSIDGKVAFSQGAVMEWRGKYSCSNYGNAGVAFGEQAQNERTTSNTVQWTVDQTYSNKERLQTCNNSTCTVVDFANKSEDTWYNWRMFWTPDYSSLEYQDGSGTVTNGDNIPTQDLYTHLWIKHETSWPYYCDLYLDWIKVRKYVPTEPTVGAGPEQALPFLGTWTSPTDSNVIDLVWNGGWGDGTDGSTAFSAAVANVGANSSIKFEMRVATSVGGLSSASWADLGTVSSGTTFTKTKAELDALSLGTGSNRYVQIRATLNSADGATNPQLDSFTIYYLSDDLAPVTNASAVAMKTQAGGADVSSNGWTNGSAPYFSWTEGADDAEGSGLKGYCLYLGTDPNGDPATTKGLLGTSPVPTEGSTCQFIVSGTNVDFANESYRGGSWLTSSVSPYYLNIKAIDVANNVFSGDSAQFQFRFDNTPPSNPSFISAPGDFVSTKEITLTWPTSAPDAASDAHSGVAGLQYRIGSSGTWYGDLHLGTEDETDLLTDDGSYTTVETPDFDDLIEGNNAVYFRTWDIAGNISTAHVQAWVKINTSAPSAPQNLVVSPSTNTTNSFAFSWDPPVTYVGQVGNITYCYTINTLPSASTCTFTGAGVTSLPADAFANQPGENTFYLVARDEAGNINYDVYSSISFTANTSAPGIPTNIEVVDASIKETAAWKLALTWEEPSNVGAGVASYRVYRSTTATSCAVGFGDFSQIATTTGTAFLDSGLSQTDYYYCVKACDSANNCSAVSSTATEYPTGRWKVPAALTSGPVASPVTTRRAVISWTTERESDSKVAFGTTSGVYLQEEPSISAQVTAHTITLTNLSPGTTYFYKAKWTDEDGNTGMSVEKSFTTAPAPTVKDVEVIAIGVDSAVVEFTATGATKVKIYYGPTTNFGGAEEQETAVSESRYQVRLQNLLDGTKYYFKLNPFDVEGVEYEGTVLDFTTYPRPRISNVRFQEIPAATTTIEVSWVSNTPISSVVTFYPEGSPWERRDVVDLERTTDHLVTVAGLWPETTYIMVARGFDVIGNEAVSDFHRFTTATDTRAPVISNVQIETSILGIGKEARAQVLISWETDEPATGQLQYGVGTGTAYTHKTPEDPSLIFYHLQVISDLSPSEVYHLQILTKDGSGNLAKGSDNIVITPEQTPSALDLILASLAETFGFLGGLGRLLGR